MQSAEHQRNAGRILGVIIAVCLEEGRRISVLVQKQAAPPQLCTKRD